MQMLLGAGYSPWEMDSIKRTAQDVAQAYSYQSTVACIQKYKETLASQIKEIRKEQNSYFTILPSPIFDATLGKLIAYQNDSLV